MMVNEAWVRAGGGGGEDFFDAMWRYWGPVTNCKAGFRCPVPTILWVEKEKLLPVPVPEDQLDEDDFAFLQAEMEKSERAQKRHRRRRDVIYL